MEGEYVERWEPVDGITTPIARALVSEDALGLSTTLKFSEITDGNGKDLRIAFGRVPAYAVHEEFVHPWGFASDTALGGRWENTQFPLLRVINSVWLQSFAFENLLNWPGCIHYRILTLDQIVDVLSNKVPEAIWIDPAD